MTTLNEYGVAGMHSPSAKLAVQHFHKLHARMRDKLIKGGVKVPAYRTEGYLSGENLVISEYGVQGMKWGERKSPARGSFGVNDHERSFLQHRALSNVNVAKTRKGADRLIAAKNWLDTARFRQGKLVQKMKKAKESIDEYGVQGMKWGTSKDLRDKGTGSQKGAFHRIPKGSVHFDTTRYLYSHGSQPRGTGQWAFKLNKKVRFVQGTQTYSAAKAIIKRLAARAGVRSVRTAESKLSEYGVNKK